MKSTIKSKTVAEIVNNFSSNESVFILSGNISASANQTFRKELSISGGKLKIFKNTLLRRAAEENKIIDSCKHLFQKQIMLVFSKKDSLKNITNIVNARKKHNTMKIHGGVYQEQFITEDFFDKLSKVSSLNELHSNLCSCIKASIVKLVLTLDLISKREV
jgi:large subunit ribosomal protein L10